MCDPGEVEGREGREVGGVWLRCRARPRDRSHRHCLPPLSIRRSRRGTGGRGVELVTGGRNPEGDQARSRDRCPSSVGARLGSGYQTQHLTPTPSLTPQSFHGLPAQTSAFEKHSPTQSKGKQEDGSDGLWLPAEQTCREVVVARRPAHTWSLWPEHDLGPHFPAVLSRGRCLRHFSGPLSLAPGLKRIHALTTQAAYELHVDLEDFDNGTAFARYGSFGVGLFSVDPEEDGYPLTVAEYSGTAGRENGLGGGAPRASPVAPGSARPPPPAPRGPTLPLKGSSTVRTLRPACR